MSSEGYSDYRVSVVDNLKKMLNTLPEYSVGEVLHSIKAHLATDTGKSFLDASDSEVYRAISIATRKEHSEKAIGDEIENWVKTVTK